MSPSYLLLLNSCKRYPSMRFTYICQGKEITQYRMFTLASVYSFICLFVCSLFYSFVPSFLRYFARSFACLLFRLTRIVFSSYSLLLRICHTLKSRAREVRDAARDTLAKIAVSLGAQYFSFVLKELRSSLTRGYQVT